jgi:hypothetical protein
MIDQADPKVAENSYDCWAIAHQLIVGGHMTRIIFNTAILIFTWLWIHGPMIG